MSKEEYDAAHKRLIAMSMNALSLFLDQQSYFYGVLSLLFIKKFYHLSFPHRYCFIKKLQKSIAVSLHVSSSSKIITLMYLALLLLAQHNPLKYTPKPRQPSLCLRELGNVLDQILNLTIMSFRCQRMCLVECFLSKARCLRFCISFYHL